MLWIDSPVLDTVVQWLVHGLLYAKPWQIVLYTLLTTHMTIMTVTIFLHRHQAHRALELHPVVSHWFRFWLWISTGQVTSEWVSIHRKHHAKCETEEDPHSPQVYGIKKVFFEGVELYRQEAANQETLARYSHGTPNDWLERHIYSRYSWQGVALLMILNLVLFGVIGITVWAVQMLWIPVLAAGVINGIGHYWGYRNFEPSDASVNVSPWGILIGGEELHNNHHTYPTSAKLSVKPYEFDIGWFYIRCLQVLRLATVKKVPPKLALESMPRPADANTLEAIIAHRYEVMAQYTRQLRRVWLSEFAGLKTKSSDVSLLKSARKLLKHSENSVSMQEPERTLLAKVRANHPAIDKMLTMREELRSLWLSSNLSREQLAKNLQAWCARAEESGVAALADFSMRLRRVRTLV